MTLLLPVLCCAAHGGVTSLWRWLKRVHQLCQASLLPMPFVTRPNLPSLRTAFLASALIVSGVPQAHGA